MNYEILDLGIVPYGTIPYFNRDGYTNYFVGLGVTKTAALRDATMSAYSQGYSEDILDIYRDNFYLTYDAPSGTNYVVILLID